MSFRIALQDRAGHTEFQISIAEGWRARARELAASPNSLPEFVFVANFAAFNALYWLWGEVQREERFTAAERAQVSEALAHLDSQLRGRVAAQMRGLVGEHKLIQGLLSEVEPGAAERGLGELGRANIRYLVERGPIERMDRRDDDGETGDASEGRRNLKILQDPLRPPREHLQALAQILYIVRCNLVHGSKAVIGSDRELLAQCAPMQGVIASVALDTVKAALL